MMATPAGCWPAARDDGARRRRRCRNSCAWWRPSWSARSARSTPRRPGEILELAATEGLNPQAIGRTRLRVGEGIVGLCAATGRGDEPAGRAEPPRLRLPAGNRRGAVRLHAGRAGAPRRARRWACSRCRTARRGNSPTRRWTSWKPWRCCWPRCWPRPAPRTAPARGRRGDGATGVLRDDAGARDRHRSGGAARRRGIARHPAAGGRPGRANWPGCTRPSSACSAAWTS